MRASVLLVAALLLTATGASAGTSFPIGTDAGTTEADCIKAGGTIVTDSGSGKICQIAKPSGPSSKREPPN